MSAAMFGRPLRSLFAAFGMELVAQDALERERQASARTTEALELRLRLANEERASLRTELGKLRSAYDETATRLWAKVGKEQRRAHAAAATAQRAAASEPATDRGAFEALRNKLRSEGQRKAEMKTRLQAQVSLANLLEAQNDARGAELLELETRLAAFESGRTRKAGDDLLAAIGAFPGRRVDPVTDRLVETLLKRSGLKVRGSDDAAAFYRLGRNLQIQGASELAAAAYRQVGPRIGEFLAQPGPDGRPVSGPDFLIIGAPRAGTTWLKRALSHHPDVMMFAGEPQFFAMTSYLGPDDYVRRFSASGARFLRRDRKERTPARPQKPIIGEKSTTYLSMAESQISLCAALYPNARIVCLVRDPVARAWSHIKHDGLAEYGEHPHKLREQPYWQTLDAYIRHGRYERHLVRWARRFAPEQIHLVDFNRLATDADAVYREVLTHIGAEATADAKVPERVNQSVDSSPPERLKVILDRAYAKDRFDIPHLREVMEHAADEFRRRRRSPGRHGASAAETTDLAAE